MTTEALEKELRKRLNAGIDKVDWSKIGFGKTFIEGVDFSK